MRSAGVNDPWAWSNDSTRRVVEYLESSPEGRQLYKELVSIRNEFVEQVNLKLAVSGCKFESWNAQALFSPAECAEGPIHIDGQAGGVTVVVHLGCCAPLTMMRYDKDVDLVDALRYVAPILVRLAPPVAAGVVSRVPLQSVQSYNT